MSVISLLDEIAPEFASETTSRKNTFIELAAARLHAPTFGDLYSQALAYLTAHLLTVSEIGASGAGPVTQMSTGDQSISYGSVTTAGQYSSTKYGVQLEIIRQQLDGASLTITNL